MNNKTKIVTFCNDGYIDFCKNWLKSVENVGLQTDVLIFTLGKLSYDEMKKTNVDVIRCEDLFKNLDHLAEEFIEFETEKWCDIMFLKLKVIKYVLETGFDVLFSDSDVVFLKNDLLEIIKKTTENADCSFQMERNAKSDCVCAGFFYIKSNKRTINLLDNENTKNVCHYNNDQNLLNIRLYIASNNCRNKVLAKCYRHFLVSNSKPRHYPNVDPYTCEYFHNNHGWDFTKSIGFTWNDLNMDEYPWGTRWLNMNKVRKKVSKIVHYNGIIGNQNKIKAMMQFGHWYI